MELEIIYSDADIIVVNKPAGMMAHGKEGENARSARASLLSHQGEMSTVAGILAEKFPEIRTVGDTPAARPGIVHRLDKDTSGIMAVARNQKSFLALKTLFQTRAIEKRYWAIVCGAPKRKSGVIDFPIGRLAKNPTKRGVALGNAVIRGGRDAITEYKVLRPGEKFSLVELMPKTGRMHQLRVHLKAIGHPVACDRKYGGKNVCCPMAPDARASPRATGARASPEGVSRQLLHARSLIFSFPEGRRLYFEADPPEDFAIAESAIF